MKIYQIYYNDKTFRQIDKDFIPLNNVNNSNKEWFEFDIIFNFLKNNKLEDDVWYGFLSPEFFKKTNLKGLNLKKHLELNTNSNVCLATSCFDQIAIYQNCFIQGETKHPGLINTTEYFLNKYNIRLSLRNLVGHSSNTVYSNYLIAKKEYWDNWYKLAKFFLKLQNEDKQFSKMINTKGKYKKTKVKLGVFIQERFPSIILSNNNYKVTTLLSSDYQPCNKLIPLHFRVKGLLQTCDYLKEKYARTGEKDLIPILKFNLSELNNIIKKNQTEGK